MGDDCGPCCIYPISAVAGPKSGVSKGARETMGGWYTADYLIHLLTWVGVFICSLILVVVKDEFVGETAPAGAGDFREEVNVTQFFTVVTVLALLLLLILSQCMDKNAHLMPGELYPFVKGSMRGAAIASLLLSFYYMWSHHPGIAENYTAESDKNQAIAIRRLTIVNVVLKSVALATLDANLNYWSPPKPQIAPEAEGLAQKP